MSNLNSALVLLEKFNRTFVNNKPIYNLFLVDGVSLWSFHQQKLWRLILDYVKDGKKFERESGKKFNFVHYLTFPFVLLLCGVISILLILKIKYKKIKILVYSVDKTSHDTKYDVRLRALYEYLEAKKIPYAEIIHTFFGKPFFQNMFKRKRLVFYLDILNSIYRENIKIENYKIDLKEFDEKERVWAKKTMEIIFSSCLISKKKIAFLRKLLRLLDIKKFFAIDDVRHNNELLLAAKSLNIKTVTFQHGRFNKYLVGWINYGIPPQKCICPDKYIIWNSFWKNRLIKLSPTYRYNKKNIYIGGSLSSIKKNINKFDKEKDDIITILIPFEAQIQKEELHYYLDRLLKCGDIAVIYKLRKDYPAKMQTDKFNLNKFKNDPHFSIITDIDDEVLSKIDLVAGTYSTLLYEMIEYKKPVAILKSLNTQAQDLIEENMADRLNCDDKICQKVKEIAALDPITLEFRMNMIKTSVSIEQTLENLLKND